MREASRVIYHERLSADLNIKAGPIFRQASPFTPIPKSTRQLHCPSSPAYSIGFISTKISLHNQTKPTAQVLVQCTQQNLLQMVQEASMRRPLVQA